MTPAAQASPEEQSTRERILEAALQCFSEHGYDGATTREIASRAGVNLGLITYYFEGKERLWHEAVERTFDELDEGLGDALLEAGAFDDRERLRVLIHRYVGWVAEHPEFIRLIHDEGKRDSPRMRWLVDRHVRGFFDSSTSALRSSQSQGFLPAGIDPLHFHYILVGSVALVFHQAPECQRLTGRNPADPAFIEAHAEAVTALLLGTRIEENPS